MTPEDYIIEYYNEHIEKYLPSVPDKNWKLGAVLEKDIAKSVDTPAEVLSYLARHRDEEVRELVAANPKLKEFLSGVNRSLKEADNVFSRTLQYDVAKGEFSLYYDNVKRTVRKVDIDFEKNLLNLHDTRDDKKIVGIFDLSTKKLTDLRKLNANDKLNRVRQIKP